MPSLFISSFYIFQQIDRQIGLRGHICHLCQFSVLVIILKCASSNSCVPPPMGAMGGRLKDRGQSSRWPKFPVAQVPGGPKCRGPSSRGPNKDVFGQNSCKKDFSKFSVIVWHGQYCYISQIKTKRVGAWPLWFFSITKHIFDAFKLNSSKSSWEKIFFCWFLHYHARYRSEEISPFVRSTLTKYYNQP